MQYTMHMHPYRLQLLLQGQCMFYVCNTTTNDNSESSTMMIGLVCCIRMIAIVMITSIKLYRRAFSMLVALGPGLVLLQGEEHEGFFLLRNVLFVAGRLVMAWRGQGVLRSGLLLVLGWRGHSVLPLGWSILQL